MNDDELDPEVLAALRNVAPASDAVRNQHIAAALAESSPVSSRSRVKWLSAAAAVIVLLVGGNALYAALSPSGDTPTIAAARNNSVATSVPVNGSVCGADLTGYTIVGTYSSADSVREVWSSKQDLVVVDQTSCAQLGAFTHPAVVASEKTCMASLSAENQAVGAYSIAGTTLNLVATPTEMQIHDGSCETVASYPLPTGP